MWGHEATDQLSDGGDHEDGIGSRVLLKFADDVLVHAIDRAALLLPPSARLRLHSVVDPGLKLDRFIAPPVEREFDSNTLAR